MPYWPLGYWPAGEALLFPEGYWPEDPVRATLEEAIHAWATRAFGFEVLWLDQDGPRPAKPYATLRCFLDREVGMAYRYQIGLASDVLEQVQETRQLTVSLQVYTGTAADVATPEAMELLEGALLTLQADPEMRAFREAQVSFLSHEVALRLDEFSGDRWERRAHCDLHFLHVIAPAAESVGRIETATPTVNFQE